MCTTLQVMCDDGHAAAAIDSTTAEAVVGAMIGNSFAEAMPAVSEAQEPSVYEAAAVTVVDDGTAVTGCKQATAEVEGLQEAHQGELAAEMNQALQAINTLTKHDVKILASMRKPPSSK